MTPSLRAIPVALALVTLAALALTQDIDKPLTPASATPQPARVMVAPVPLLPVRAGRSARVEMAFRIAPGFHINSNQPNSDLLVPTVVKLNPPTNLSIAKLTYPTGQDLNFPFAPHEKLNVYTGDFSVGALVSAARTTPPGRYRVHGTLKYQACDNKACYPPSQVPVAFDVKIGKPAGTQRIRRNPAQSPHVHQ